MASVVQRWKYAWFVGTLPKHTMSHGSTDQRVETHQEDHPTHGTGCLRWNPVWSNGASPVTVINSPQRTILVRSQPVGCLWYPNQHTTGRKQTKTHTVCLAQMATWGCVVYLTTVSSCKHTPRKTVLNCDLHTPTCEVRRAKCCVSSSLPTPKKRAFRQAMAKLGQTNFGQNQVWPNHLWPQPSLAATNFGCNQLWPQPTLAATNFGRVQVCSCAPRLAIL